MAAAALPLALGTAGTATAAGTAGLFGTAGVFSFMQTASTLGTLFSIGSVLGAGAADNSAAKMDARWMEIRSRQEQIRGQQEATAIKDSLVKSIASANARGAASGIDITSGSPVTAVNAAIDDANTAWGLAKDNALTSSEAYQQNAYMARQQGKNAVRSARTQAFGLASDFMGKQYDRGMRF